MIVTICAGAEPLKIGWRKSLARGEKTSPLDRLLAVACHSPECQQLEGSSVYMIARTFFNFGKSALLFSIRELPFTGMLFGVVCVTLGVCSYMLSLGVWCYMLLVECLLEMSSSNLICFCLFRYVVTIWFMLSCGLITAGRDPGVSNKNISPK